MSACIFSVPLCFRKSRQHLFERCDSLLGRLSLFESVLGGEIIGGEVRGHTTPLAASVSNHSVEETRRYFFLSVPAVDDDELEESDLVSDFVSGLLSDLPEDSEPDLAVPLRA
jgi:hypothetical protein